MIVVVQNWLFYCNFINSCL